MQRIIDHKPNIVAITEVKPKNQRCKITVAEFNINGYELFTVNVGNDSGRGIIIYVTDTIHVEEVKLKIQFKESLFVHIKLQGNESLLLGCIYRSDSGSDENNIELLNLLRDVQKDSSSNICILGDFNLPNINWTHCTPINTNINSYEFKFIECIRDAFLTQHIIHPTRSRGTNNPNVLDLVLTNEHKLISNIIYMSPLGKSDHCVLLFEINCRIEFNKYVKKIKNYNIGNYHGMRHDCSYIDWENILDPINDINEQWSMFTKILETLVDKHIPQKNITCNDNKHKGITLDSETRKLIKRKDRLWTRYMETRETDKYLQYCKIRNKVRKMTRKNRKTLENKLAKDLKHNPKLFWKYYKSKTKLKEGIGELNIDPADPDSARTNSDREKANILANYFSSVFTQEPNHIDIPALPKKRHETPMQKLEITRLDVYKMLKSLNINKSPGPDGIHPRILVELSDQIAIPLTIIFKNSLRTHTIPCEWKKASITAILKKGNKHLASNYRPISLTSVVCKGFEHLIRAHIIEYMKRNKLISNKQFGFIN